MCGVCGIVATNAGFRAGSEIASAMRDTMLHRGPDDGGVWCSPDRRVALGAPAPVDRRPVGGRPQPMSNEDGTVWITYNGEVYNHAALRAELEAKGHVYRSQTDTETILHLYEEEGPRVRRAAPRDVRVRDLGLAHAGAVPRPRPARHQAAVLRAAARRVRLRLGDQGAARAPGDHRRTSTRRRSTTTSRSCARRRR